MNRRIAMVVTCIGILAGVFGWSGSTSNSVNQTPVFWGMAYAQEMALQESAGIIERTMGPEDAKVTLIEYASFTCPHCANFHKGPFQQLKADFIDTGKIHFIYRDVYFDRLGLSAAMIARCGSTEQFFEISDTLYTQQRDWIGNGELEDVELNLALIASDAGMEVDDIIGCLSDEEKARQLVEWFRANAEADGINSTPSLVINGVKYGNMQYADLKVLIDGKLAEE